MSITTANVTTAVSNVYVSSGNTAITFLSLCNYSSGNITANVHVVPAGESVSNLTLMLSSIELQTLDTYQLYAGGEKLLLGNNDTVRVDASGNAAVTAITSYTTI